MAIVLLTGASGFVGSQLLPILAEDASIQELVCVISPSGNEPQLSSLPVASQSKITIKRLDITCKDEVRLELGMMQITHVVHTAALTDTMACEKEPERATLVNATSVQNLLQIANQYWPCGRHTRFILFSTDWVYSGDERVGNQLYNQDIIESSLPRTSYGKSKLLAEQYTKELSENYAILRCAPIYGVPGPVSPLRKSFVDWILKTLKEGKSLSLFADEFRTPVCVRDVLIASYKLLSSDATGIFNMGGPERVSRYEVGLALCTTFGFDPSLATAGSIPTLSTPSSSSSIFLERPRDLAMDSTKIETALGFKLTPLLDGLKSEFGQ